MENPDLAVKLIGLRYDGGGLPLALVVINGEFGIYTEKAVRYLITTNRALHCDTDLLEAIHLEILANRYTKLQDISTDDITGQGSIFEQQEEVT